MSILPAVVLAAAVVVVEEEGSSRGDAPLAVPRSGAIVIDGTLEQAEWRGSAVVRRPEGDVLLRHDGKYLYVGVRTARRSLPSLLLARGTTVRVVHSYVVAENLSAKKGATWRRYAEMRIPLDQLDARDPRISVAFSIDDDGRSDEITAGTRAGRRTPWTRLRLAPASPRLG